MFLCPANQYPVIHQYWLLKNNNNNNSTNSKGIKVNNLSCFMSKGFQVMISIHNAQQ